MHNEMVNKERNDLFLKHFGQGDRFFMDPLMSTMCGRYEFDVLKFDDWCHKIHGYKEEKHGSCVDFITLTWGKDVALYIQQLLEN